MILLDTHVFIWLVNKDSNLSVNYVKLLEEEKNKYLSVISCWEISLLISKERLKLKFPFREWLENAMNAYDINVL